MCGTLCVTLNWINSVGKKWLRTNLIVFLRIKSNIFFPDLYFNADKYNIFLRELTKTGHGRCVFYFVKLVWKLFTSLKPLGIFKSNYATLISVKSAQIRSHFWSKYRKTRTRNTPHFDTFHTVTFRIL